MGEDAAAEAEHSALLAGATWANDTLPTSSAAVHLAHLLARPKSAQRPRLRALLAQGDLARLAQASVAELVAMAGLSLREAQRVAAAFALGRELERSRQSTRPSLHNAELVFRWMAAELADVEREHFYALVLDAKHRLRQKECVSQGTLTASLVHPREFFRAAIRLSAAAVIAVHNHPSGDPEPSAEDLGATRRLLEAGRLLGVPLLDHVVIGGGRFVSLRERLGF